MRWSCGDLPQKVIHISTPQRNYGVVWTNYKTYNDSPENIIDKAKQKNKYVSSCMRALHFDYQICTQLFFLNDVCAEKYVSKWFFDLTMLKTSKAFI